MAIAIPYTFVSGTTIVSAEVNSNFSTLAGAALDRTGDTFTGNIAADSNVTIDGVDISDFLTATQVLTQVVGSAAAPSVSVVGDLNTGMYFTAADEIGWSLGGTQKARLDATGLDVAGGITAGSGNVAIVDGTGKIPGINATYFASLDAANLTNVPGTALTGTIASGVQDNITRLGTLAKHVIFTDNTYDIGANGATRPRDLFLSNNAVIGGTMLVGGLATFAAGIKFGTHNVVAPANAEGYIEITDSGGTIRKLATIP